MTATNDSPWVDAEECFPEEKWYPLLNENTTEEDRALWNNDPSSERCMGDCYVAGLMPNDEGFEGWFPLGSVSLVFGSTGAGKSTWVLDLLAAQLAGERVAGKQTYGLPYIVLMQDRNEHSLNRTLFRMKLSPEEIPVRVLPGDSIKRSPAAVVEDFYLAEVRRYRQEITGEGWKTVIGPPRIVFIEGLDIWVPKASDKDSVAPILKDLEATATRYNLAIICTVGSPKMKPKEVYAVTRDSAFGSQVWGRMVETMVQVLADSNTGRRLITVMPRNGKEEKFTSRFQNGRLVVDRGIHVVIDAGPNRKADTKFSSFVDWWAEGKTHTEAEGLFGISRRTFFEWQAKARKGVRE